MQKVKTLRCFVVFLSRNSLVRNLTILLFFIIITGSAITASADFCCSGSYIPPLYPSWTGSFYYGGSVYFSYAPGSDCNSSYVVLYTFPGNSNYVYALGICEALGGSWCANGSTEDDFYSWCDSVAADTYSADFGNMTKIDSFTTQCTSYSSVITYKYYAGIILS